MDSEAYTTILKESFVSYSVSIAVIIGFLLLLVFGSEMFITLLNKGNARNMKKSNRKILSSMTLLVTALCIYVILFIIRAVPIAKDIKAQSFSSAHGEYYMYNFNYKKSNDNKVQFTFEDGEIVQMILPTSIETLTIDRERYPAGRYMGENEKDF